MDIRNKVSEILTEIFDMDVVVEDQMSIGSLEDWDSLAQMEIITLMESEFGVKFTTSELHELKNMGEYIKNIEGKIEK